MRLTDDEAAALLHHLERQTFTDEVLWRLVRRLRGGAAVRTCPAVHASAHGLLVCTREHGHAPPCAWRRKRTEEKCPVCTGACEWDKGTTG